MCKTPKEAYIHPQRTAAAVPGSDPFMAEADIRFQD